MPPCSHFSTPHGSRSVFRCLHIPGLRCFHQAGSGSTNGYGQGRGGTTKDAGSQGTTKHTKKTQEPRMDTNGYGQGGGTTNGHEWTRMSCPGWFSHLPSWGTVRHLELSCRLANGGVLSRRGSMPATILSPLPQCQLAESVLCFVVADSQIRNGGLNSNTERIEESPLCASLNVSGK